MEAIAYYAYEASSDLAAERGTYSSYRGSKWDRGLLPQDTIDLLEQERGINIDVPRGGRLDWNPVREKISETGHAQLQCARHRSHRDHLQHHRHALPASSRLTRTFTSNPTSPANSSF